MAMKVNSLVSGKGPVVTEAQAGSFLIQCK